MKWKIMMLDSKSSDKTCEISKSPLKYGILNEMGNRIPGNWFFTGRCCDNLSGLDREWKKWMATSVNSSQGWLG